MVKSPTGKPHDYIGGGGRRRWWVGLAFAAFAALVSVDLGGREFWLDECITVGHIASLDNIREPFHPPGYYWLLLHWKAIFGNSDVALRAFSVPWALAALILVWLLGQRLLRSPADLLALGLFTLSPLVILYVRMARYFAMTMAVSLLVAYLLLLAVEKGKWRHYLLLSVAAVALLWTDYIASALLLPAYLYLLYGARQRGGKQEVGRWLVAAVLPLAAVAPRMGNIIAGGRHIYGLPLGHLQHTLYGLLAKVGLPVYAAIVGETTEPWRFYVTVPALIAGVTLLVSGFIASKREQRAGRWLKLATWSAAIALVAILLSTVASAEPLPRVTSLTLFAVPFAYMLMAQGAMHLGLRGRGAALICIVLAGNLYGLHNYFARQQFLNPGYNVPWREVASAIESHAQPGDVVIEYYDVTFCRYWQGSAALIDYDDGTRPEQLRPIEEFPGDRRRIWLVARDRGAPGPRQLTEQLRQHLSPLAGSVEVFNFMALSPSEKHWRQIMMRRPVWDAYVKIYLFAP